MPEGAKVIDMFPGLFFSEIRCRNSTTPLLHHPPSTSPEHMVGNRGEWGESEHMAGVATLHQQWKGLNGKLFSSALWAKYSVHGALCTECRVQECVTYRVQECVTCRVQNSKVCNLQSAEFRSAPQCTEFNSALKTEFMN